jgi:ribonuclease BN (tRNA processing enzyme)
MKSVLFLTIFTFALTLQAQTQLVLLGTGTPFADPERSGPSLAIVVGGHSYLVDAGPGLVRRASAAYKKGLPGLQADQLRTLFLTHLHSDHTAGLSDLIFTPAVLDRNAPLQVLGPKGTQRMIRHTQKAFQEDMKIRIHGLEFGNAMGYQVHVKEISPGIIYQDSLIRVKAFRVKHGSWKEAFGFRFETADKVIVVSGDCTYSEELIEQAKGADILVHEVYSSIGLNKREQRWKNYHSTFHTSPAQLGQIATAAKPKVLVLTHQLFFGTAPDQLLQEVKNAYPGKVVQGNDLDVFD